MLHRLAYINGGGRGLQARPNLQCSHAARCDPCTTGWTGAQSVDRSWLARAAIVQGEMVPRAACTNNCRSIA